MQSADMTVLLLALAVMLATARVLGELARAIRQPAVLGEILAGVLLGPTVFGAVAPEWQSFLFPEQGPNAVALGGITSLAVVMFLLVAGMEVDLSTVWRQGRTAIKVGAAGMIVPFLFGILGAATVPGALGRHEGADPLIFALFLGTALSISALPVIAKTLMDLKLYRTDLGMVVISAAMIDDVTGWIVFAVILGMIETSGSEGPGIAASIALTLSFVALMLTVGRWLIHKALPYVHAYSHWPGGVLGFALILAFFGAAFTEHLGIHAIFGAFLVGVAIGDSSHFREHTRVVVDQFVSFIFAPVFFASIGLKVNFVADFDPWLTAWVLVVACAGKLFGVALGARWAKMPTRSRWAIGFAMNARGAMEIILGLLALEAGVIDRPLFVALVVMAIATSVMSGPMMRWILARREPTPLRSLVSSHLFVRNLAATTRRDVIRELSALVAAAGGHPATALEAAAWSREEAVPSGIGHGVAVPNAHMPGFNQPVVAVGLSAAGIDFDAPDGRPAHVVFFVVTAHEDPEVHLDLLPEIAQIFSDNGARERVLRATTYTEFIAALRTV